jgi:hypothetical protein
MSQFGKRQVQAPLPVSQHCRQVYDAGELVLEHFTPADFVALDPYSLPEREPGPALQTVSPLLAKLAAIRDHDQRELAADTGRYAEMLAGAAAGLEKRRLIRPGPPGPATATWLTNWAARPSAARLVGR